VFDWTVEHEELHLLRSTRHFGSLVFYLVINKNALPLLFYFLRMEKLVYKNLI
jgi:hypothetical protein